jgi:hypothetical protein
MTAVELKEKILRRIDELVGSLKRRPEDGVVVDTAFMGALSLMQIAYGGSGPQVKALMTLRTTAPKILFTEERAIRVRGESVAGALLNLKEDVEAGLTRNLATEIAGEVIGDFLALAKSVLRQGNVQASAVLAVAALEDALKRKAVEQGINVEGKTLDAVVNALKARSFFSGAQAPIVNSYVKLRNAAMHADWSKIQSADIGSLIGFLEPFLLEHFR